MASVTKHALKPLKGNWRGGHHLGLWPVEETHGRVVRATAVDAILFAIDRQGRYDPVTTTVRGVDDLEDLLEKSCPVKGTLTIWLPSGWEHLLLTGLAELMDHGAITWRYANIDTHKVLVRGLWRSKPIIITSLGAWTGGEWQRWSGKTAARGADLFMESLLSIFETSRLLALGSAAPTASAAGLLAWRSWIGPRIRVAPEKSARRRRRRGSEGEAYVAPLFRRPERARQAERHCAYGLVHRQMVEGHVAGPIYCLDVATSYLLALVSTPLPCQFLSRLHKPPLIELALELAKGTGCALVQLRSPETPYPVRRKGKISWATGEFWTWLAGAELAHAVVCNHVQVCEAAYLWSGVRYDQDRANTALACAETLKRTVGSLAVAVWRSIYSQLVGRFAGWQKVWKDCTSQQNFGRWAAWLEADPETGQIVQHRSIAGRCQRLAERADTSDSVPLVFGVVTAQARYVVRRLCEIAGRDHVLAIEADSVWVDRTGWQALQRRSSQLGMAPETLVTKDVFRQVWMTGKAIAVVDIEGTKYLRCPGVPADIAVGTEGNVSWPQAEGWATSGDPNPKRGVKRTERRYSAKDIMKLYAHEPRRLDFAETINDPMLGPELLEPVGAQRRQEE